MRINSLHIENFRAIKNLDLKDLEDTIVIAGSNGCGKTQIYNAIRLFKSTYGGYQPNEYQQWWGEFQINLNKPGKNIYRIFRDRKKPIIIRAEFEASTKPFFEVIRKQKIKIIISEILELELYKAPEHIIDFYESIPEEIIEKVELTSEARELAEKYIIEKVVGKTSRADCQHIAIATVCKAGVLASWNFKHIVNLEKIRGYNSINFREGYPMIEIRTPKEIFGYEND